MVDATMPEPGAGLEPESDPGATGYVNAVVTVPAPALPALYRLVADLLEGAGGGPPTGAPPPDAGESARGATRHF